MICLGASSDNLMMNADTDFGPRVSFELNSLFPSSLFYVSMKFPLILDQIVVLENFIGKLRIVVLLRQNVEEFSHRLGQMFKIRQALHDRSLRTYTML